MLGSGNADLRNKTSISTDMMVSLVVTAVMVRGGWLGAQEYCSHLMCSKRRYCYEGVKEDKGM